MSETSVILRFKSKQEYPSIWHVVERVKAILTENKLTVSRIKPLPYKSAQKKGIEFRVPTGDEYLFRGEDYTYYYFYYMANNHKNLSLETIQKKVASGNGCLIGETLIALQNELFLNKYNEEDRNKHKTEKFIEKNQELKALKQQTEKLQNKDESILKKRRHDELQKEQVHQKLLLDYENEVFILKKQKELLIENFKSQMSHLGGEVSIISNDNFQLTEEGMALRFNPCGHCISRADYFKMLAKFINGVYCVVCRESLNKTEKIENYYLQEDWSLTYVSDALLHYDIIKENAEPLTILEQMKRQGKLKEVRKFHIPKEQKEEEKGDFIIPKVIYKEESAKENSALESELPKFKIDPTGKHTMNSALLNSILELDSKANIANYLKERELSVPGAQTWKQI